MSRCDGSARTVRLKPSGPLFSMRATATCPICHAEVGATYVIGSQDGGKAQYKLDDHTHHIAGPDASNMEDRW